MGDVIEAKMISHFFHAGPGMHHLSFCFQYDTLLDMILHNKANALPDDAIVRFENKQYAFVAIDSNRFQMREIHACNSENGYTEILDSNKANETFLLKRSYNLLMKLKNTSDE